MKFQPTSPGKIVHQPEPCDEESADFDLLQYDAKEYIKELKDAYPSNFRNRITSESNQFDNLLFDLKKNRIMRESRDAREVIDECLNQISIMALNWQRELNNVRLLKNELKKEKDETAKARREAEKAKRETEIAQLAVSEAEQEADSAKELLNDIVGGRLREIHHSPPAKKQRTK